MVLSSQFRHWYVPLCIAQSWETTEVTCSAELVQPVSSLQTPNSHSHPDSFLPQRHARGLGLSQGLRTALALALSSRNSDFFVLQSGRTGRAKPLVPLTHAIRGTRRQALDRLLGVTLQKEVYLWDLALHTHTPVSVTQVHSSPTKREWNGVCLHTVFS